MSIYKFLSPIFVLCNIILHFSFKYYGQANYEFYCVQIISNLTENLIDKIDEIRVNNANTVHSAIAWNVSLAFQQNVLWYSFWGINCNIPIDYMSNTKYHFFLSKLYILMRFCLPWSFFTPYHFHLFEIIMPPPTFSVLEIEKNIIVCDRLFMFWTPSCMTL